MSKLIFFVVLVVGCAHVSPKSYDGENIARQPADSDGLFMAFYNADPSHVWSATISDPLRLAISNYVSRRKLLTGLEYGGKVRQLDIRNQSAPSLKDLLKYNGFIEHQCTYWDFSKTPRQPKLDAQGKVIPIWVFSHPDGSKIAVRPRGDPVSKYPKKPDSWKSVLYSSDANPCEWDSEAFLVDYAGNAVPKQASDLNNPYDSSGPTKIQSEQFINEWVARVHANLIED